MSRVQPATGRRSRGPVGSIVRMSASINVALPNPLIGISDAKKGVIPTSVPKSGIAATESCILIACDPEVDGETKIRPASDVDPGDVPAFDDHLATPSGGVRIVAIDWKPLLVSRVSVAYTDSHLERPSPLSRRNHNWT